MKPSKILECAAEYVANSSFSVSSCFSIDTVVGGTSRSNCSRVKARQYMRKAFGKPIPFTIQWFVVEKSSLLAIHPSQIICNSIEENQMNRCFLLLLAAEMARENGE